MHSICNVNVSMAKGSAQNRIFPILSMFVYCIGIDVAGHRSPPATSAATNAVEWKDRYVRDAYRFDTIVKEVAESVATC